MILIDEAFKYIPPPFDTALLFFIVEFLITGLPFKTYIAPPSSSETLFSKLTSINSGEDSRINTPPPFLLDPFLIDIFLMVTLSAY